MMTHLKLAVAVFLIVIGQSAHAALPVKFISLSDPSLHLGNDSVTEAVFSSAISEHPTIVPINGSLIRKYYVKVTFSNNSTAWFLGPFAGQSYLWHFVPGSAYDANGKPICRIINTTVDADKDVDDKGDPTLCLAALLFENLGCNGNLPQHLISWSFSHIVGGISGPIFGWDSDITYSGGAWTDFYDGNMSGSAYQCGGPLMHSVRVRALVEGGWTDWGLSSFMPANCNGGGGGMPMSLQPITELQSSPVFETVTTDDILNQLTTGKN